MAGGLPAAEVVDVVEFILTSSRVSNVSENRTASGEPCGGADWTSSERFDGFRASEGDETAVPGRGIQQLVEADSVASAASPAEATERNLQRRHRVAQPQRLPSSSGPREAGPAPQPSAVTPRLEAGLYRLAGTGTKLSPGLVGLSRPGLRSCERWDRPLA